MKRPDFFLVGAPKCATTAMTEYCSQHPELFIPRLRQKDIPFFGDDLHRSRPKESLDEYLAYYREALPTQRAGEACVWYMYSSSAPTDIRAFAPNAQIVIILRNPVDMVYSQHSQLVYTQDEDIHDFAEALEAESDRRAGRRDTPMTGNVPKEAYYYTFLGEYSSHVARYFKVFGRDRVHVVIYDDLRDDTSSSVVETFRELGVDPAAPIDFRVVNASKVARSNRLQRMIQNPPARLVSIYRAATPERAHGELAHALVRINTRYQARPPMPRETRRILQRRFLPDVERLSSVLGRDLTGWCTEPTDVVG
jgi:Sulfotransferase domain.